MKIALVCIAKNEDRYIDEWINYHLKLGFDDIFIYQNNWRCSSEHPNVHKIEFDGEIKQLPAYNDFIINQQTNYDWGCFIDVDEYIVLKKHSNIKELVSEFSDADSIAINWEFYYDSWHYLVNDVNYSVVDRFIMKEPVVNQHVKVLSKLKPDIRFTLPHNTNKEWVSVNGVVGRGPFNPKGSNDVAIINHYYTKTKPEFIEKIERGRADAGFKRKIGEFSGTQDDHIVDLSAYNFKHGTNYSIDDFNKIDGFSQLKEQGKLLIKILDYLNKSTLKIAEVGVYKGKMTAMWNLILMVNNISYEYDAIDHFRGSTEHDNTVDYYGITKENLNHISDKINIIRNDSLNQSEKYDDECLDIVYIDASHDYESVKKDIEAWYPKVKYGGVLCGDDYIRGWDGVIKAVDEKFSQKYLVGGQQWWIVKEK